LQLSKARTFLSRQAVCWCCFRPFLCCRTFSLLSKKADTSLMVAFGFFPAAFLR
jgi:hypothetical protein